MSVCAFKKIKNDNQEERIHEKLKFLHKTRFLKKIDLVLMMHNKLVKSSEFLTIILYI